MDAPFISCHLVFFLNTCLYIGACKKECFSPWHLQIEPDRSAIIRRKFVPCYLHIYYSFMHQSYFFRVDIIGPYPVYFMPWSFMTKHKKLWIAGRKLHMSEPCILR